MTRVASVAGGGSCGSGKEVNGENARKAAGT